LPLVRRSDVFAGPTTFRAAMCGCGTCSKITDGCDPGWLALGAAVSVTEAGYTAPDRPSAQWLCINWLNGESYLTLVWGPDGLVWRAAPARHLCTETRRGSESAMAESPRVLQA
jgi:hypothetical protein